MASNVLIIHNSVDKISTGDGDKKVFAESAAGLLEEIRVVSETLGRLGIEYRVRNIDRLADLPGVLGECGERVVINLVEELAGDVLHANYVPAVCEAFGRACTGNGTGALMLSLNKWQAKAMFEAAGVPTPASVVVGMGEKIDAKGLGSGKYVVKPVSADASEGIDAHSVAELGSAEMENAIEQVHRQFKQAALVEQFIPDRELNVSVLEIDGEVRVLPIAEIDFSAFAANSLKIVGYSAKWHADSFGFNNTPRILPARLSEKTARLVREYAIAAWKAIGCQDYARVDFRMDSEERLYALEVNPNPDISLDAGFAAALGAGGVSYERFVGTLIDNALKRNSN